MFTGKDASFHGIFNRHRPLWGRKIPGGGCFGGHRVLLCGQHPTQADSFTFYDLCAKAGNTFSRVAVVTDIRRGDMFSSLFETLDDLRNEDKRYRILFLDANDFVLINRFKETRRKHPLAENNLGSLEQAVKLGT